MPLETLTNSAKNRVASLLRRSEGYFKTDMIYLARGSFWSTLAQIVSSLAVLTFAIVVSRVLPKEVYGQYKYILSIVAVLGTFSLNGLGSAVFQSVAAGYDGSLHEGFWQNIRWSFLVFGGSFAFATYYFVLGNTTLAFGILIGGCLSPFFASANFAGAFLTAKKDFARAAVYFGIVETVVAVGALVITILLTHNPLIIASVYFLSNTLATLWLYHRVVRVYKPDTQKKDPTMLTYGKHLSLMGVVVGVAGNIDEILAFHFLGPAQLAIYTFAVAIPDQTKGPLKSVSSMVQTNFVTRTDQEIHAGMKNKMLWLFFLSAGFIFTYIIFAPLLYKLLFPNYLEAVWYSQLYALSLLSTLFNPAGSYLSAKKKVREQYFNGIVGAFLQIVLLFFGVVWFGLMGLIVARICTRLIGGVFTFALYRSATHSTMKNA